MNDQVHPQDDLRVGCAPQGRQYGQGNVLGQFQQNQVRMLQPNLFVQGVDAVARLSKPEGVEGERTAWRPLTRSGWTEYKIKLSIDCNRFGSSGSTSSGCYRSILCQSAQRRSMSRWLLAVVVRVGEFLLKNPLPSRIVGADPALAATATGALAALFYFHRLADGLGSWGEGAFWFGSELLNQTWVA